MCLGVRRELLVRSKRLQTAEVLATVGLSTRRGMDSANVLSKLVVLGERSITVFFGTLRWGVRLDAPMHGFMISPP